MSAVTDAIFLLLPLLWSSLLHLQRAQVLLPRGVIIGHHNELKATRLLGPARERWRLMNLSITAFGALNY